ALSGPVKSMPVDLTGGTEGVEGRAVICHTDLHGENLMRGVDGHLYILDWEGAMLSPPEQDLFFFVGDDTFVPFFLPAYEREVGPVTIDGDLIHFYYLRRGLEDLVDWIRRILSGEGGGERDASDLVEAADNLAGLAEAAPTVARLRREVACVV
ncbi:MAG: phosphotransferase family protein, partial [Paracoccaceae bacterium]